MDREINSSQSSDDGMVTITDAASYNIVNPNETEKSVPYHIA